MNERGFRLLDTGLMSALDNIALNQVLLSAHAQGASPHTLRFVEFEPSALVGFHQSIEQELDSDYCRQNQIEIQRRITGGGAIYFDPGHVGWELYLDTPTLGVQDYVRVTEQLCETAAQALRQLGIEAQFRPRNDIEVEGRKISGTGGVFDGRSFLYQGTLLIELDIERMINVLRIPQAKLRDKAIQSVAERVTSLSALLNPLPSREHIKQLIANAFATRLGCQWEVGGLSEGEKQAWARQQAVFASAQWLRLQQGDRQQAPILEGIYRCRGGTLRLQLWIDRRRQILKQLCLTGDFFVRPRRAVADLEARLKDTPLAHLQDEIAQAWRAIDADWLQIDAHDIQAGVAQVLASESAL